MVNSSSIFTVEILNSITPEKPTNDLGSKGRVKKKKKVGIFQ